MAIAKFVRITLFLCFILGCTKNTEQNPQENTSDKKVDVFKIKVDRTGLSESEGIIKTSHGVITFKFYPKVAPNTVARIIQLIQSGFYDGLSFHRVVPDFVIQTGDPTGTGTGGSGQKLQAEFNKLSHVKGTMAMARTLTDENSADSQFYIALTALPHLDKKYTVFGQVVDGLDVLDKVRKGDKIISIEYIE
ncbi:MULTISPECIES: peptidylprolyl isomerase [Halobacteriovorax]|uniref:Peptidyl-prolyl cis-trans isomerase n=1 Tax=Halobacteriovorax vibrionivorans TaxID=2152716 RepID=A0ABY0IK03_9BACT|nr:MULTISPECIES: peptidylprolyl isomerase [Halobacteriovorax]RZF23275.1 peptidylprolyl isomerase [Halobacteriovorax vibrionivorans]TGD46128.1 peptidylprolyl isomerase [Halobacteriovorax sp. Y22]